MSMFLSILALLVLIVGWSRDVARRGVVSKEEAVLRALPSNLCLWWARQSGGDQAERGKRMSARCELLSRYLSLSSERTLGVKIAAVLPPGALNDAPEMLPEPTRSALHFRHARWDGNGLPRGVGGAAIPLEAQILSLVDWMETRHGAPLRVLVAGLQQEQGIRFSPTVVKVAIERMRELLSATGPATLPRIPVSNGALISVRPIDGDSMPRAFREEVLATAYTRIREYLRPSDAVFCTDEDVVVWLPRTDPEGVVVVVRRLESLLEEANEGQSRVRWDLGVAIASVDGAGFSELLAKARERQRAA